MSFIEQTGIGLSQANSIKEKRQQLVERYSTIGRKVDAEGKVIKEGYNWLKGLNEIQKYNMALLFENQARNLRETTTTQSSGSFETVAFSMIRRIYSKLLLNDIASVQAMSNDSGSIFYFYPQISNRVDDDDDPARKNHTSGYNTVAKCVGANCPDTTYQQCQSLYDYYYNDQIADHSKGSFTLITATGEVVKLDENKCWTTADTPTLSFDGSIRQVIYRVSGFDGNNSGTSNGHTARIRGGRGLEIDTEEFLDSLVVINNGSPILDVNGKVIYNTGEVIEHQIFTQRYGYSIVEYKDLCRADGNLYLRLDLSHPLGDCDTCPTYDDYIGAQSGTTFAPSSLVVAWRRYDDLEFSSEMGEVTFTIEKETISVVPRKLRARWSPEMAYDVQQYHNIDAEAELTALMSEQIAMEIDREGIKRMKRAAAWTLRWDANGWKNQGSQKYTIKEWNQTLVTAINKISAQIHKSTFRGGANFIVVSTEVSALFDDLQNFMVSSASLDEDTYNLGMKRIGTLSGRYTVYVDPYSRPNDVLVGHKGTSMLDTGFIYAPYVPLQLTDTITDPRNFTMIRGISTRYAMKVVNNKHYGMVKVDNIFNFDTRELR